MGAARWVVIGTAIVAAAVAFHLLLSPDGSGRRAADRPETARSQGTAPASTGSKAVAAPGGPPQEELDAASRDAMRSFLRDSAQDDEK